MAQEVHIEANLIQHGAGGDYSENDAYQPVTEQAEMSSAATNKQQMDTEDQGPVIRLEENEV